MGDFHTEAFEIAVAGAPAREAVTATLIDTDEPFDTMEFASNEFTSEEASSSLAFDTKEPILDFERSELFASPAHTPAHEEDISFETEPGAVLEIDVNRPIIEALGFDRNIEITEFDLPSGEAILNEGAEAAPSNLQATPFEMNVGTAFEAPNENAGASLLTAEEPLGNVLDETSPLDPPIQDRSSNDSLNLELTELETFAAPPVTNTQFDLIDTPDASSPQASVEGEEQAEDHLTTPATRTTDWTSPRAGAYSTAQLDSVVMPIETAEYLAQHSLKESARSEASQEASFTTPAKWTEEEARFAAIDIEAVPVDEHDTRLDSDVPDDALQYVETPAVNTAKGPANGAPAASELSAAAIEEIVRRVIARMSDSVVREVAWEVVPDCVERVVDQLTRESLSKPT